MKTLIALSLGSLFFLGCSSKESTQEMAGDPTGAYDDTAGPESTAIDPVTYGRVVTDSAWKTTWKGNWFFFQSEQNLMEFKENPAAFVTEDGKIKPSLDPVTGDEVRRDTDWKVYRHGTWYYFTSEKSLRDFQASPRTFVR